MEFLYALSSSKLASYNADCVIFDKSGKLYLGNSSTNADLISSLDYNDLKNKPSFDDVYAKNEDLIEVEEVVAATLVDLSTNIVNLDNNKANKTDLNNYLPLSGGTVTGGLTIGGDNNVNITSNGIAFSRSDGPSYIWNTTANNYIAIGTNAYGNASISNAALVIVEDIVRPGTTNKFNLGSRSYIWKSIHTNRIVGSNDRTFADLSTDTEAGMHFITNILYNNGYAADYALPANSNANGIISVNTHDGDNRHLLGFSSNGKLYHRFRANSWSCISNPSMFQVDIPSTTDVVFGTSRILPEIINDNTVNVFHEIAQTYIKIERAQSSNNWLDTTNDDYYGASRVMSSGRGYSGFLPVAYNKENGQVGDKLRITVNGAVAYARLSHAYVYFATRGATVKLTIEKNTYSTQDLWAPLISNADVCGWSGPNYYGLNYTHIGQTSGTDGYSYRFTFEITAINSSYNNRADIFNLWAISAQDPWNISNDPRRHFYYHNGEKQFLINRNIMPEITENVKLGSIERKFYDIYSKYFVGNQFTGEKFITSGGTSSQFVKGDGSLDSNTYLTSTNAPQFRLSIAPGSDFNDLVPGFYQDVTGGGSTKNAPYAGSYGVLAYLAGQSSSPYFGAQIHVHDGGQMTVRGSNNGTWNAWRTILDSSNYTEYVVPKTGGTFTGVVAFNDELSAHDRIWLGENESCAIFADQSRTYPTILMESSSVEMTGSCSAAAFYESSDERLKTFTTNVEIDLDELSKCRKSHFTFNDKPEQPQLGVSAQEIQKLYPEVVNEDQNGYLSVDYGKLSVIALAAIDKLYERIKELESKFN